MDKRQETDEELRDKFLRERGALQVPMGLSLAGEEVAGFEYHAGGKLLTKKIKHVAAIGSKNGARAKAKTKEWAQERLQEKLSECERKRYA